MTQRDTHTYKVRHKELTKKQRHKDTMTQICKQTQRQRHKGTKALRDQGTATH